MSDKTPRTDAYMGRAFDGSYNEFIKLADFARQLERELAAVTLKLAEVTRERDGAKEVAEMLYDKWENGDPCTEGGGEDGVYIGNAVRLSKEENDSALSVFGVGNALTPMQLLEQRAEQAEALVKKLEDRLEISHAYDADGNKVPFPEGAPDGIACRDETIRLLEARAEAAEKDAARYRYWRQHHGWTGYFDDGASNESGHDAVDAAIDAAMEAGRG